MAQPLTKSTGREEYGRSVERSPCHRTMKQPADGRSDLVEIEGMAQNTLRFRACEIRHERQHLLATRMRAMASAMETSSPLPSR